MSKLLTISVAAFNAEEYIRQTLESLIIQGKTDLMEVFIIDDGGTDGTLEIAKEFQTKYPNTFIPVHKENGGYGSTVNYSIEKASGRYFKLLDGDDWFQTEELDKLLDYLETEESDAVVTHYYKGYDVAHMNRVETHRIENGRVLDVRKGYLTEKPFDMWALVYKTDILRESGLKLPEKMLYTDRYYATIPFAYVNSVRFLSLSIYCYRVGRDGQSMSIESQVKHFEDRTKGIIDLCKFYEEEKKKENPRCKYLLKRIAQSHVTAARVIKYMPKTVATKHLLMQYENTIMNISQDIIDMETKEDKFGKYLSLCRKTNYLLYSLTPTALLK